MSCDARETHGRTWLGRLAVGLAKRCQQWTRSCVSKGIVEIEWSNGGGAGELDDKIARQLGEREYTTEVVLGNSKFMLGERGAKWSNVGISKKRGGVSAGQGRTGLENQKFEAV